MNKVGCFVGEDIFYFAVAAVVAVVVLVVVAAAAYFADMDLIVDYYLLPNIVVDLDRPLVDPLDVLNEIYF